MRRLLGSLVVSLSLVTAGVARAAVDVTTCGQTVPDGQVGHLTADLACASGVGVRLGDNAKLKLHGHVLSGSPDDSNVTCAGRRCKLIGPGEIVGGFFAVTGLADLSVVDVVVRDQVRGGFDGLASVVARRVTMTGIGFGYTTPNLTEVIRAAKLNAASIDVHGNAGTVSVTDYVVRRSTISGNGGIGIGGPGKGKLIKSIVNGNLGGPLGVPVDVYGVTAPRLVRAVCGHSYDAGTGMPFGICLND